MPRIRSENLGAALPLRPGNLVIAHVSPLSRGVHMIKLIVGSDGQAEWGEYLIPPREQQRFRRGELTLDAGTLESLGQNVVVDSVKDHRKSALVVMTSGTIIRSHCTRIA